MVCPCCCTDPGACCVENFDYGYRSWTCSQKTWCACRAAGGWFRGFITCPQASCTNFDPCVYCCNSLPTTFNVSINGTIDQMVVGTDNIVYFNPFGSTVNTAQAIVYNKSLIANVTLAGGEGACRDYSFNGCGPFGDFTSLRVFLSQSHSQGRCRWFLNLQAQYLSCATFGNQNLTNCVTGQTDSFFRAVLEPAGQYQEIDPTCDLSGLTFAGTYTFLSQRCIPRNVFGNTTICRTASIDGCAASTIYETLPQIQSTFTWSATIS